MKKYIKISLIVLLIIIGIILVDTLQAKIFKNSPLISIKESLEDSDSWVDKGLIIDTYYCTKEQDIITIYQYFKGAKFTCPIDNIINERIVMVKGNLYYDTGMESTIEGRCGNVDGKITSNIASSEIPKVDNQANFEGNYGYQFVDENTIDLFINKKWIIFKRR